MTAVRASILVELSDTALPSGIVVNSTKQPLHLIMEIVFTDKVVGRF